MYEDDIKKLIEVSNIKETELDYDFNPPNNRLTVRFEKPQHITVISLDSMVSFYIDGMCFDVYAQKITFLSDGIPYYTLDYHVIKEIIMNECTSEEFMEFLEEIDDPVFV